MDCVCPVPLVRLNVVVPELGDLNSLTYPVRFGKKFPVGSVQHTAEMLVQQPEDMALATLRIWTHEWRQAEAGVEDLKKLNKLVNKDVVPALLELQKPPRFVRKNTTCQLEV